MGDVGKNRSNPVNLGTIGYIYDMLQIDTANSAISDTELGIFDSSGTLLYSNDDSTITRNYYHAAIQIHAYNLPAGTYYIAAGKYDTVYNTGFSVTPRESESEFLIGGSITVNTKNNDALASANSLTFVGGEPLIYWLTFQILNSPIAAPSCFRKGTIINTDQEDIKIENIVTGYNTINNKPIKRITSAYNTDGVIVKVEKGCLGENKPSNDLFLQKDHKLLISPFEFAGLLTNGKISFITSNSEEILYNVLLDSHEIMKVNNIEVETMNPDLELSKYFINLSEELKEKLENNTVKIPII